MYVALTEEQQLFQTSIQKFLTANERTLASRQYRLGDASRYEKIWQGLAELGIFAITVPEQYGGVGLTQTDLIPVFEEIGRVVLPGVVAETVAFATPLLTQFGTDAQKAAYLPKIAAGSCTATVAISEEGSFLTQSMHMTATKVDGGFVLNGEKTFVIDGDRANILVVTARVNGALSVFIVDREQVMWQAERVQVVDETLSVTNVQFQNVHVPQQALIGAIGDGEYILNTCLPALQAAWAMMAVGGMEQVVEMCAEYAKTREQFGHAIGVFQAVKHRIVDMKIEADLAKSLAYYANFAVATQASDGRSAAAQARSFAAEAYIDVAANSIQLHGGIGFTTEIDCHLFYKRARLSESYLGFVHDFYEIIINEQGWRKHEKTVQQSEVLQSNYTR